MSPTLTCLALALVGVDLGYQPAPNGGVEFIIQINPTTLQAIRPGDRFELDVPREARQLQPSHFVVTLGNESLPHILPAAASASPATAPIVTASPLLPATAAGPVVPSAGGPISIPPPTGIAPPVRESQYSPPAYSAPAKSTAAHDWPLLNPRNPRHARDTGTSANSTMSDLAPVNTGGGNSAQPDRPWLGMCLLVIALLASNTYVGWLFWDARQRYRGLLARTFNMGRSAAEA